ncbi:MAG: MFS transporter [Ktedonobacterales bacterium]
MMRPTPIATSERHRGWLLAVLLAGQFMANIDAAVVNVATPSIRASLHASGGELEFVISGYVLAYAVLLVTGARLGDTRGYRRLFIAGLGVFTLASLACGLAPNAPALIIVRVVQGVGAALMVPQVLSGIQLNFTGAERARAVGFYAAALSGGAIAGQILGGVLISANLVGSGWRSIFLINVPIGAVLLLAAMRYLPADRRGNVKSLDVPGVATLALTLLLAIVPLAIGRDLGWPLWTWACLVASIPALMAFVAVERRVARRGGYPLVNLIVLARPAVSWGLLALGTASTTYFALLFTLALYLQQGLGKSALFSGLALVSWVTAFGISGPLLPRLHLSARASSLVAPIGYLVLATAYLGVCISLVTGHASGVLLFVLLGLGGFGLGTGFAPMVAHVTSSVPDGYAPDMSGLITTTGQIAAALGIAIFGTAYLNLAPHPGPRAATHAFALVTAGFAVAALLSATASYLSNRLHADATIGEQPHEEVDTRFAALRRRS